MEQDVLSYRYEREKSEAGMTALGGLPVYLDMARVIGLGRSIGDHLSVREAGQGWRDEQVVLSLILLNLGGGDCVEDLGRMEGDEGFCRVLRRVELDGLSRRERRAQERRWRKERQRAVPSPSAAFRYLEVFHDAEQEKLRQAGNAFIPAPNQYLAGFSQVNRDMVAFVQSHNLQKVATLDMDGVLVETNKTEALYCYKHFKSYQPLNVWWAEQRVMLYSEFRDGNVPAGYQQVRVFEEALVQVPAGVEKVQLRVDTAGYEHDLLRYCEESRNKRFGKYMKWDGEELILWHRERCGKSEEAHSVMKEDLAGGKLPSGKFGVNAAWWWIMVLALNLNQVMKQLILGHNWTTKRLKAIRFSLINLPARVMEHARELIIRLGKNHPSFDWLVEIRTGIANLAPAPSG